MTPTTPALDIRLLGPPEVFVSGRPLVVDTRKAVAILAILAAGGRAYARDELAALLWPDADDAAARGALRRTLSALRAAVGEHELVIDRTRVDLARDRVRVDLVDLEELAGSTDPTDLVRAVALARGPFLAGFSLRDSPDFDDWRAARAMAVERTVAVVLDRLADARASAGDLAGAIAAAAHRVDLDPLDEGAQARLMDLYAASGDRPAAMRQYRVCVATLERELGVAPLAETTARYEAIRDAAPASGTVTPTTNAAAPSAVFPHVEGAVALPLVGRDDVVARLGAIHADPTRDGRIVVIAGEAGIGKTRLAEAFTSGVRGAGGVVIAARAHAAERRIAYGSMVELLRSTHGEPAARSRLASLDPTVLGELRRLLPEIDAGVRTPDIGGPGAHARLVAAIGDGLTAATAGSPRGVIWLDDVQWLDAASLEAVAYLARRLADRPISLLLCWRREDLEEDGLAFARDIEADAATTVIELERLDRPSIATLIAAATGGSTPTPTSVDRLAEASEGLPLYIVESLARGDAPAGAMPEGVRAVLRARLDTVDGAAEQVLAAAAAIGRSFDLPTVRYASGRSEVETVEALETLQRRGLIRDVPGTGDDSRYDFSHAALRDLADDATSLARRRLLHRRIAEALRMDVGRAGRDDLGRAVLIAQHERAAGRDPAAAEAFRAAGDRAADLYANADAIEHYAAALALGHPDVVGLDTSIGVLRTRMGDYAGAIGAFEGAAALAGPDDLPGLELHLARAHIRRGDLTAADRHLDAGLATATDPRLRARMLVDRSIVRRRKGDGGAALAAAAEALAIATDVGDAATAGAAHRMAGLIELDRGDARSAREALAQALTAARDDPDPTAEIAALVALAMAESADGQLDTALDHAEVAAGTCRRIGDRHLEAAVENHVADLFHAAGRDDEAMTHLRRAVEAFAEVGGSPADPDPGIWMLTMS